MSSDRFSNGLSRACCERLYLLLEELGETQQAIGKILRHGYDSSSPFDPRHVLNRAQLEHELGHVLHAIDRLNFSRDIRSERINESAERKALSVEPYLHHQTPGFSGVLAGRLQLESRAYPLDPERAYPLDPERHQKQTK